MGINALPAGKADGNIFDSCCHVEPPMSRLQNLRVLRGGYSLLVVGYSGSSAYSRA
jgi:hypothetical protein